MSAGAEDRVAELKVRIMDAIANLNAATARVKEDPNDPLAVTWLRAAVDEARTAKALGEEWGLE